jgi:hypothetical protein
MQAGRRLKKVSLAFYPSTPVSLFVPQSPGLAGDEGQSGDFKGWSVGKHRGEGRNAGDLAFVGVENDADAPDDDDDDDDDEDDDDDDEVCCGFVVLKSALSCVEGPS